jgi:CRP-like cAMP-binding protein
VSFFDYPGGDAGADGGPAGSFLADASDADWDAIREHSEVRRYRPGETVVARGDCDRALFIIVSGTLEASVSHGRRGRDTRVAVMEAGTVIGEVGFFDGQPRSAAVRAVTDAHLLRLSRECFDHLAAKHPALGRAMLLCLGGVLAGRLRAVEALNGPGNAPGQA